MTSHGNRYRSKVTALLALLPLLASAPALAQHGQATGPTGPAIAGVPGRVLSDNPSGYPAGLLDVGLPGVEGEPVADAWRWLEQLGPQLGIESPREELALEDVAEARGETVLRFGQRVGDVPVFRGVVVVVVDGEGRLDDVINGYLAFDRPLAERLGERPRLSAGAALAQALAFDALAPPAERVFAMPAGVPAAALTRLVYVAPLGSLPRLAWEVHPPGVHLAQNWRVFYDAQTGETLLRFNDLRFENEGRVYDPNPGRDGNGEPVVRTLTDRDDADGYLSSPLVQARNCVEDGETFIEAGGFSLELCTEKQVAQADENGDFLYDPDTRAADDLFAEVQMYYHVTQIYEHFRELGLDHVNEEPLPATVNFQIPGVLVGSPQTLAPFDNAFFFPAGDILPGVYGRDFDSIVFGQGTNVDFSYDGDVIYHEFSHAVFEEVASSGSFSYDVWGLTSAPGALNEGQADYFAAAYTGDPEIGEYVGPRITSSTDPARNIRDIGGDASCPGSITGEVHFDSVHMSSALWEIREAWVNDLGGDGAEFDAAMLAAMRRMTPFVTFDQIADIVENELVGLDADLAEPVDAALVGHGVRGCERFITLGGLLQTHPVVFLYGTDAIGLDPFVPGFVQYRVTVDEEETANTIAFGFGYGGGGVFGGRAAFPRFLVRRGEPVTIQVRGTQVSGSWDEELRSDSDGESRRVVRYQVEEGLEPGDYYFLPVGTVGQQGQMTDVRATVRFEDLTPEAEAEAEPEPVPDAGTGDAAEEDMGADFGLGDVVADTVEEGGETAQAGGSDGGCGCAAAGGDGADAGWLGLALGLVGIATRRRRLTSRGIRRS